MNNYVVAFGALFIVLYVLTLSQIGLPSYIEALFKNTVFRVLFLSLLLIFNFKKTPHVAVIVAMIFVITLEYLNRKEMYETVKYIETYQQELNNYKDAY